MRPYAREHTTRNRSVGIVLAVCTRSTMALCINVMLPWWCTAVEALKICGACGSDSCHANPLTSIVQAYLCTVILVYLPVNASHSEKLVASARKIQQHLRWILERYSFIRLEPAISAFGHGLSCDFFTLGKHDVVLYDLYRSISIEVSTDLTCSHRGLCLITSVTVSQG